MARGDCQRRVTGCVPYCPLTREQRADPTYPCRLDARLHAQQDARLEPKLDNIAHFGGPHTHTVRPMLYPEEAAAEMKRSIAAMRRVLEAAPDPLRQLKFPPKPSVNWGLLAALFGLACFWATVFGLIALHTGK